MAFQARLVLKPAPMTQTVEKNAPKLRFPEFDDGWKPRQFSDFLKPDFRDVPKPSDPYLALGVRSHGKGTFQKPNSEPDKIAMETLYEVHAHDLIVNITFAWEGAIAIATPSDHGGLVSHRFPTYTFDRDQVVHEFFEYIIEDRRFRQTLDLISPGGAGRNRVLSKKAFIQIKHRFPTLPEQRKIAGFLGVVGAKIAQLSEKKHLLEDFKKGCIQQLFSQKIRFRDDCGNNFPDWTESRLCEVATFSKGKGISKADIVEDGATPCIRYGEIYTIYREHITDVRSSTNVDPSRLYMSQSGDVIIPASGENPLDMARACCVQREGVALGGDINVLRGAPNGVFLAYYLNNAKRKEIASFAQGNSVVHLYASQMRNLSVLLPHPDEQRKIADFLSALDMKIDLVNQELNLAQTFKQGLLQQMFV